MRRGPFEVQSHSLDAYQCVAPACRKVFLARAPHCPHCRATAAPVLCDIPALWCDFEARERAQKTAAATLH